MSDMKTAKYLWVKSGQVTTNLAIILKPSAGGSLRIGDWRILHLLCHILWLTFSSLHVYDKCFIQRWSLFQKGWSSWYIFSSTNIRSWRLSCFSTRNTIIISTLGVVEAVVSVVVGVLGWSIVSRYTTFLLIFLQSEKNILLLMTFLHYYPQGCCMKISDQYTSSCTLWQKTYTCPFFLWLGYSNHFEAIRMSCCHIFMVLINS